MPGDPASLIDQPIRRDDDLGRPLFNHHPREEGHADEEATEQEEAEDGNRGVAPTKPIHGDQLLAVAQHSPGATRPAPGTAPSRSSAAAEFTRPQEPSGVRQEAMRKRIMGGEMVAEEGFEPPTQGL